MKEDPNWLIDESAYRIAYLIAGYIRRTLTQREHDELDEWVAADDKNMLLFEELTDEKNIEASLAWMDKVKSKESFQKLQKSVAFKKTSGKFKVSRVWIAAATTLLVAGTYIIFKNPMGTKTNPQVIAQDMAPGGNKATLTLSDGSVIDLTSAKNGLIRKEKGAEILKLSDGRISYLVDSAALPVSLTNILTTPVGGEYQVILPDGTKVWLNAATTLKYPARFSSGDRKVELNGEAYFEVAKNEKQPFHVLLSDSSIVTVLGTHFNIASYENENEKMVTLLQGSVMVNHNNKIETISPGMQVKISGNEMIKQSGVDTEEIMGWKNGLFVFHDAPIEFILRQVQRWYGATVVYNGGVKQLFNATILRSEPLSKLLHLLQLNGYVNFKIQNKTDLCITPMIK